LKGTFSFICKGKGMTDEKKNWATAKL